MAERLNTPGRPWVRRFLRVLGQRVPGRPRESDWERRVCDGLARRRVNDIESQVGERLEGYGAVRFDLAITSIRIGGEPIGEPTNPYGRLVSTAEPAEQAKRKRDAATGQTDPLGPFVIEVDVHLEHRTLEGQSSDYRRDRKSRKEGWAVERVGEAELAVEFDGTISHLVEAVALRRVEVAALIAADLWPPTAGR